jgi:hypothetical protein
VVDKLKGRIEWVKSSSFLAGLALFFISIFFFYDLFDGRNLLTERDLGPYFIPPRFFWTESIKHGDFPLWNPFQFSGHPFFANPQHAILYPLNGLFFLMPFDLAFNTVIILHFFLGGLFTYLLLKDLKVNSTGALISGLIFMLSGYLLSVHSLLTILLSSIWTPLIIMFFRRATLSPGLKNEILTAIFLSISFLGGGIEIVYGNFFVLVFMLVFSPSPDTLFVRDNPQHCKFGWSVPIYWGKITERTKFLFRGFRSLMIISVLFVFLSAIQFIPFLELFMHSIRGNGISYFEATIWSFAPKDILLFFLPDAYGYWLDMKRYWITQCWLKTLYTGGLPFILSLIFFLVPHPAPFAPKVEGIREGPFSPSKEREGWSRLGRERKLYLALMLFSLFLSLGKYNPLYTLVFKYVPFLNGIRYPVKFLYIFILILSTTAGLGFQRLSEYSKNNEKKRLKHLLILFSLLSGSLLLFSALGHKEVEHFLKLKGVDFPDFNVLSINLHHAQRFLFYLALFFLLLRVGYEVRWKGWAKVLLVIFLTTDLFGNMGFYGKEKISDYFRETKILETISSDKGYFRIFTTEKTTHMDNPILIDSTLALDHLKEKHLPSMNLFYRLHNIWGIDVIMLKRISDLYRAFVNTPSIGATHLVDLYGVKYVISVIPIHEDARFKLIYARLEGLEGRREDLLKEPTVKLYENRKPILRGWLVKDFRVMDDQAMLSRMTSDDFYPDQEVLLEEEPPQPFQLLPKGSLTMSLRGSETTKAISQRIENKEMTTLFRQGGITHNGREGLRRNLKGGEGREKAVEFVSESNNRLRLLIKTSENTFFVLNDTYFPGWKAFVDGQETKIHRADYAFRAILLNTGTHQVEFIYDPLSFKIGAVMSILGVIGCVTLYLTRRKPNNKKLK